MTGRARLLAGLAAIAVAACTLTAALASRTDTTPVLLVDVRDRAAYDAGHLLGSRYAGDSLASALSSLTPGQFRVGVCCSPASADAVDELARRGWDDIVDLGTLSQASDITGMPIVPTSSDAL